MLRYTLTLVLNLSLLSNICFSQIVDLGLRNWKTSIETPFHFNKKTDVPVSIAAATLIVGGFVLKTLKKPIDSIDLANPNISKIPSFDLSAIHQANPGYQRASDILEYTAVALPFLAFVDKRVSGHAKQIVAMYLETF